MQGNAGQLQCLLGLVRIPGVGPVKIKEMLDTYGDLSELFDPRGYCKVIKATIDREGIEKDLKWAEGEGCYIISILDQEYPSLLREVHGAPVVLFVRGNVKLLARPQIAMVGSRNPTHIGREIAVQFAKHFSEVGFTVTSGLAVGIDAASHTGGLMGSAGTVAVLANGLDTIYPASHRKLAHSIAEKGALVSEFPIGTPPLPAHFPRRNRIISGLSVGTLVVEAAIKSGSLITAKLALDQGREVFAIPGSIHNPLAKGCHALIRQGAKLVEAAEDVIEELGALVKYVTRSNMGSSRHEYGDKEGVPLSRAQEALLDKIGYDCTSVDSLVERTGLAVGSTSSMLLELELRGCIASVPGGYVRLLTNIPSC